jgi:succinate dehydrogenase/fumarate reductase flavoprotein subunit
MKNDVIIIGGGCAGMVAALEAREEGAKVVIMDRGPLALGTNSALSNATFSGPTVHYAPEKYIEDTLQIGKGINRELLVRLMAEQALTGFSLLRSLDIKLVELSDGYYVKSTRPDLIPGITLVRALAEKIKNLSEVEVFTGLYVTEILKDGGKVCGVRGFDRTGEELFIYAPTVVLATGGAGAIYLRNDNQKSIMGQGYYLAAKTGVQLWDMEFVQFYPLVIAQPGLPSVLLYPPYPQEARLINAAEENILKKHGLDDPNKAHVTERDRFSAILFQEGLQGPLYMDYRAVPASRWMRHPLSLLTRIKFDFQREPFAVSPAAHFFMGGVRIDESGQTSLPGLFACGEVAWGLHGANRKSGNALMECVVFGRIAGRSAAQYALNCHISRPKPEESSKDFSYHASSSQGTLRGLRTRIRETAWTYAGVVRSEKGLREGLAKVTELEIELRAMAPHTVHDKRLKGDLMGATFVLKAVLYASLSREESRGSFIREDFPDQDDLNWHKNSFLAYDWKEDKFSVSSCPAG